MNIEKIEIGTKEIYIFDSHHHALIPWSNLRRRMDYAPVVLSFDHHTDTHSPFLHASYDKTTNKLNDKFVDDELSKINFKDEKSIQGAIYKLKNDEHIKTAIHADIVDKAFIVSHSNTCDNPCSKEEKQEIDKYSEIMLANISGQIHEAEKIKRPYEYPKSSIYIPSIYPVNKDIKYDVDSGHELESDFLRDKFTVFQEMNPEYISNFTLKKEFILDIDMDYFHIMNSLKPEDSSVFAQLVRDAQIITIAREKSYVELIEEEYKLTVKNYNDMESSLLELIRSILTED